MKYTIAALFLLLVGCGETTPNIGVVTRPNMPVPSLQPVQQLPVEWYVITRENAQARLQEIEQRHGSVTLFATSAQGYQNLSVNVADLRRYIMQQQAVIAALREYYEAQRQSGDEQNRTQNR